MKKKLVLSLIALFLCSNAIADDKDHVWVKAFVPDYTSYLHDNGHTLVDYYSGVHELFISNPTDHPITFTYVYVLCATTNPGKCDQNGFIKTLNSGETYHENYRSHLMMEFNYPVRFNLVASTQITGEFNARTQKVSIVTIKK